MQLVEKHIIKKSHEAFKQIDKLSFLSKNLYNAGLYEIRQFFFKEGGYLNYNTLQKKFQKEKKVDYYALPTKVSQQILMVLDRNFKSFFNAQKSYKENPKRFKERPKIPKYKDKTKGRNLLVYSIQSVSSSNLKKGLVVLSQTTFGIKTKQQKIQQVRVVPRANCYVVEIIYNSTKQPRKDLDKSKIAGIDIGLNNLVAVTSNKVGFKPFLINGRPLKSINQFYNKQKSYLQSRLVGGRKSSNKIQALTFKRNCKIDDYLHKASRQVINELVSQKIGNLVIGKNDGWKQEIKIGKTNNQNFVSVPHARFIQMLTYKAELEGIKVTLTEESYTSKCSFLDNEQICKHIKYQGRRIKRGLFKTAKGFLINADVNASYNIIKKVAPKIFNGVEAVVVQPYRYFSIK